MNARLFLSITLTFGCVIFTSSCAEVRRAIMRTPVPTADDCLRRAIDREINAKSYFRDVPIMASSVSNGEVRMNIPSDNDGTISDAARNRLRGGQSLQIILRDDRSVSPLADFEGWLRARPGVRDVTWTAGEPCTPGFVCGTTSSSERSAGEDDIEAQCRDMEKRK